MKTAQFWVVSLLMLAAFTLVELRGNRDHAPESAPLNQMPVDLQQWHGEDLPLSATTLEVLGQGDFLNRVYTRGALASSVASGAGSRDAIPVQLFIGYFPTQRTGQSIHSPQNCLPGSGWSFLSSGVTSFQDATGKTYKVGDYTISDGRYKQEVLYWYQTHGRSIASDYSAKAHMLWDAIEMGRTDAALVRLITPIEPTDNGTAAHQRLVNFAKLVTPLLPAYVPN